MDKKAIYNSKKQLINKNLGGALEAIGTLLSHQAYASLHERITDIQEDYHRMLNYMRQGYPDPSRNHLYLSLLRKLDRITNDAALIQRMQRPLQKYDVAAAQSLSRSAITHKLEDDVSELALIGLGMGTRESDEIHASHHQFMATLFEQLSHASQWHHDDQEFYENLLLSPTTDNADCALMVSAISLSSITYFDIRKYITLAHVYQQTTDERVKQRALVGWALTTTRTHDLYPEVSETMEQMMGNEDTAKQLLELQMQMFFCMSAERDTDEITREIMPNLMKNKGFDITRHGIVEKEDDPMQDILDPDAAEHSMEELERSFQRMTEMQRSGSDIYFGGFRQMKRFPFFYTLCNWFCPFYPEHPGIVQTRKKLAGNRFLDTLMTNGPFCDSDKYSFAIALNSVIDKLPEGMKTALNDGVAFGPMASDEDMSTRDNIRLMYLQDLYRFFRLCDRRNEFYNPFGGENGQNALFFGYAIYDGALNDQDVMTLGHFLLKRNEMDSLERLLACCPSPYPSPKREFLLGCCALGHEEYARAISHFKTVVENMPDNKRALGAAARAAMLAEDYDLAEQCYRRLSELSPESKSSQLSLSIALIKNGKAAEATPLLYKLSYEAPEDDNVRRALAWDLLACQKTEQAIKEYERLTNSEHAKAEDHLNMGYCQWVSGHLDAALTSFKSFLQQKEGSTPSLLKEEFEKDSDILQANGITPFEMNMMTDMTTLH